MRCGVNESLWLHKVFLNLMKTKIRFCFFSVFQAVLRRPSGLDVLSSGTVYDAPVARPLERMAELKTTDCREGI